MIFLCYALMVIVPYLLCGVNSAIILTKIRTGEDIRSMGSGNAGLTNTLRTQGKLMAALVLLGDVAKGVLSVFLVRLAFFYLAGVDTTLFENSMTYVGFVAGIFGMLGHVFPIYFKFKGGKGVLVTVAVLMAVEWLPACLLLGIFMLIVVISKYVSLGSIIAAACYPITICIYSLIVSDPCVYLNTLFSAIIAGILIFMHRGNIVRLKNGTEKKLGQKA